MVKSTHLERFKSSTPHCFKNTTSLLELLPFSEPNKLYGRVISQVNLRSYNSWWVRFYYIVFRYTKLYFKLGYFKLKALKKFYISIVSWQAFAYALVYRKTICKSTPSLCWWCQYGKTELQYGYLIEGGTVVVSRKLTRHNLL